MATTLNDNIYVSGQKHVDGKRLRPNDTPWTSAEEVILSIEVGDRAESQEFYIVDKLWWFKGGVEDENLVEKLEGGSIELVTKFTSTVIPTVDDSTIVIPANNTWLFDSVPYTNTVVNVLPFDYAYEGFSYFLTIVATKFNTFVAKVGGQSISNPDEPIIDEENELFLTTYLIYDNYIDVIVPPVSPNIYVEKESFAPLNLIGSGYIASIELDKRNNLIFSGTITKTGNVIKNNPNHFVIGLPFTTTNKTANPIEIEHLNTSGGSGSIAYFNTEELSYFLQPNEVAIWISEILNGQKIHRRVSSYIDRDNVIFRSGTKTGKDIYGDLKFAQGVGIKTTETEEGLFTIFYNNNGLWTIIIDDGIDNPEFTFIPTKGFIANKLFDIDNDEKAYIQKGHIVQLEENVFNLELNKADLVGGLVPSSQLPAYVDDVLEFANLASFPVTGDVGKIYVALDSNKQYRWSGSSYIQITNGLIASTNDVPEGSNLYFTTSRVLSTLLTGLSLVTGGVIVSTDSVLIAFGKIQKQLNDFGTALGFKQDTLTDTNFGTFTNSVENKETQANTDILGYIDVTTGKWVKQTFSKLVDYLKGFFQTSRIIVTSNITAVNGSVYHNNGNNTFTDPAPENNRGYSVKVISGTATIGGVDFGIGTIIERDYDGTDWKNEVYVSAKNQIEFSGNKTVVTTWFGKEVTCVSTGVLTIPSSLPDEFNFCLRADSGTSISWAITSPHTWRVMGLVVGVAPSTMTAGQFCQVSKRKGTNEIRISGL